MSLFAAVPMAYAGSSTQAGSTVTLTVDQVASAKSDFVYACCSPNDSVEIFSTEKAYVIVATNKMSPPGEGNNYATLSTASGYALQRKTLPAGQPVPDQTSLTLSGDWIWMGGSGT